VTITVTEPPVAGVSPSPVELCISSPSIDLFLLLGSTAQPGGTWTPTLASGTSIFNPALDNSGIYTYTLTATPPCSDVSVTVSVNVHPIPDAGNDGNVSLCSNNDPVDLMTYLGSTAQSGGTWSPTLASGSSIFNPAVDNSGTYTYTITGIAPCVDDTAQLTISVTPGPEAGTDNTVTLCVDSSPYDLFTALGPLAQAGGTWSPSLASGSGVFDPTLDTAGSYTYTFFGTQPCDNDTAVITVIVNPIPDAGSDGVITLCSNSSSVNLFDSLGGTPQTGGTWSPTLASGSGIFDPNIDNAGTYTYTVGGNLCSSATANVTVTINQAPVSGIALELNTCINETSVDLFNGLDGSQDLGGIWSDDDSTGALTGNIFNPSLVSAGTYHFTYTVSGTLPCSNSSTQITVIVNPLPFAGNDATTSFCSNGTLQDLFTLLGSNAETGGTWSPPLTSGTGIFDPSVDLAGIYTYTVNSSYCSSDSASVTVSIIQAPNPGVITTPLEVCLTSTSLDLNTALDGSQDAGVWTDDDATGQLSGSIFNPSLAGVGTYHFTYTVTGSSPCIDATNTLEVNVIQAPNAGTFTGIVSVCPSAGVFDLNTLLSGQDANGVWTDSSNQVVVSPISVINFATGTYTYTYTVTNNCDNDEEQVQFTMLSSPQIITPNISINAVCLGSNALVNLSGMVDGSYTITYDLNGANVATSQTASFNIASGAGSFEIPSSLLSNAGTTVISISNIINTVTNCSNSVVNVAVSFTINPPVNLSDGNISANAVCLGSDVIVSISSSTLPDGDYQFNYSIPGATPETGTTGNITIASGSGQFTIAGTSFTTANNYNLTITGITSTVACSNLNVNATSTVTINPLLDTTGGTLSAQNTCLNNTSVVTISGANNLADGDYQITYTLTGANTASENITIAFVSGSATFTIPSTLLTNAGDTTIEITDMTSSVNICGTTGTVFSSYLFTVENLATPQLIQDGNLFCEDENPTIANLTANISNIVGNQTVIWYNASTGGTAYNETDLLVNGTTYYATLAAQSGCESSTRLEVTVDLTICDDIVIPDGFSPNNDGINDTFEIVNLPIVYPNFKLEIYNRYGNLLYVGNKNTPNWDGTTTEKNLRMGGNVLPTGVYFYILYFNDGIRKDVQGRVYLSR
jgi:gliding motility-associated-like protein